MVGCAFCFAGSYVIGAYYANLDALYVECATRQLRFVEFGIVQFYHRDVKIMLLSALEVVGSLSSLITSKKVGDWLYLYDQLF